MTARLRKALEARATAWAQVQDIQARRARAGYEDTAEDDEAYSRALDEVDRQGQIVEEEERTARLTAVMNASPEDLRGTNPIPGAQDGNQDAEAYRAAYDSYLRRGLGDLSPEDQALVRKGFAEIRAQSTSATAGGYTVPEVFLQRMTEARKAFGGISQFAETIRTSGGEPIVWPKNDDTGNVGAILGENVQVTEQDATFGQNTLAAYMYTSKLVRVSLQLLQDSAFDLERWLATKLGERIGRAFAAHLATGAGTTQPEGIVTGLTLGVTSAANGVIAYDDLVDLEHSIDPAYRGGPDVRYVLHDSVVKAVRKLKDTTGRPLWAPSIAGGVPSTINGHAYTVDNGLATLAAGSKSVVFGDIRAAYVVREVAGAMTMRLAERYADYLQVGFLGFQRLEGKVQDTGAAAVLTTKAP